jgi:hypothetical protein
VAFGATFCKFLADAVTEGDQICQFDGTPVARMSQAAPLCLSICGDGLGEPKKDCHR